MHLLNLGFENLQPDTIVDGQIMELNTVSDVIRNVCTNNKVSADNVVTGVSGEGVERSKVPHAVGRITTAGAVTLNLGPAVQKPAGITDLPAPKKPAGLDTYEGRHR